MFDSLHFHKLIRQLPRGLFWLMFTAPICPDLTIAAPKAVELIEWEIVATYPHDPTAFTQGLVYMGNDTLVESTGRYGKSDIRSVDLKTGKVISSNKLPAEIFAEGLTALDGRFFQLSWQEGVAFEWSFQKGTGWTQIKRHSFSGEGWGLATDGKVFFQSNGTSEIQIKDAKTFKTIKTVSVRAAGQPFDQLNELEFIDGFLFANRWQSSSVVKIDVTSGDVVGILDFQKLIPDQLKANQTDAVLNGIAWDPNKRIMFITGKLWPSLFAIKIKNSKKLRPKTKK